MAIQQSNKPPHKNTQDKECHHRWVGGHPYTVVDGKLVRQPVSEVRYKNLWER